MSMKKTVLIFLSAAMILTAGCDAFRRLAGRPVSADIEARRSAIEARKLAEHQACMDSLAKIEKMLADSLAVMDSLKAMEGTVLMNPKSLGGLSAERLEHKYHIIVGSFMDKGNAEVLRTRVASAGYEAVLVNFRNGYTAVGVSPTDNIMEAYASLKQLQKEPFSPEGIWILAN